MIQNQLDKIEKRGAQKALEKSILLILKGRFQSKVPEDLADKLANIQKEEETLFLLSEKAATLPSIDEFMKEL